ncbi:DctP family TRAP transporter solute-binding subunit [Desertibacillus haloalkaliphilus]|uniref:DctP family TRAP transporter solute-binding subunit n=1 Tax=Desertibacillus haloalkaliphilus TaxID=1328930 RepID=UPI001C26D2C5|nr:DctP family TRAP transporter solute-binding subunit [Desertibacillus haloalkaliphilus]MBU8906078.1 DctP family TRAP transporter solute-binding subunit [Desertibacillus haloalkaliphilus]
MTRSKILYFALSVSFLIFLTACGSSSDDVSAEGGSNQNDDEIKITLAHIAPDQHSYTLGINEFIEAVEEETDGRVTFEVFGNGQIGGEREVVEQVSSGSIDMTMATSSPTAGFSENLAVLELPFLFENLEHVYATLDGEIGKEILEELAEANLKAFSFWERGFNHFGNNEREVTHVNDMEGLQVRSAENDVSVETYRALGADPTPIAWPEVYTSLQQGVVSGLDNGIGVLETTGVHEALDYLSLTEFFYTSAVLMMNQDTFNSLPADIQEVFERLGKEYAHRQREINQELEQKQLASMEEHGIIVTANSEIDTDSFRNRMSGVYDQFEDRFGNYVERIRNVEY